MDAHLYDPKDFRYYGIKISDPESKILGTFHFMEAGIIYSPIVPRVFEELDFGKYGMRDYYTTMTLLEIIIARVGFQKSFVHTGEDYSMPIGQAIKQGNRHILREISKEEIIEYATNPEKGIALQKHYLNIK